jgi:hypothetical protein
MADNFREDGWYRMASRPKWDDWEFVPTADAEEEIRTGGGSDLMYLTFGYATSTHRQTVIHYEQEFRQEQIRNG